MFEIIGYIALLILAVAVVAAGWWIFRNTLAFNLIEFERIAVFRTDGTFSAIRGPGTVRVWPTIFPFLPIIRGDQVRGTHGQVVTRADAQGLSGIRSGAEMVRREGSDFKYNLDPSSTFDLRETAMVLGTEHCNSRDNVGIDITPAIVYQITDPAKLVLNVSNHELAMYTALNAALRAVIGTMTLTDVTTAREEIASQTATRLASQADRWGIAVISVEIQAIEPDTEIMNAINERRAAEENAEASRQTLVVQAEARRQGAVADNERNIAEAEAEKQATITRAEGEKEAEILKAEGATALYKMLMELGDGADIALRYEQIRALRNLGDSPNSKLVVVPANVAANMATLNGLHDIPFVEGVMPTSPNSGGVK